MDKIRRAELVSQLKKIDLNIRQELLRTSEEIAEDRMAKTKGRSNLALHKCSYVLGVLDCLRMSGKIDVKTKDDGYDYFTKVRVDEYIRKKENERNGQGMDER